MNDIQGTPDRDVETGSRSGMTRDAARAEMDRFRGVAEYETRKIFGQHSAMKQATEPPAPVRNRSEKDNKSE